MRVRRPATPRFTSSGTPSFRGRGGALLTRAAGLVRGRGWYTRFPVLQRAYRGVVRLSGQKVATVHGHEIEIDPTDSLRLLVWGDYEPAETAWYRRTIKPGDTVV